MIYKFPKSRYNQLFDFEDIISPSEGKGLCFFYNENNFILNGLGLKAVRTITNPADGKVYIGRNLIDSTTVVTRLAANPPLTPIQIASYVSQFCIDCDGSSDDNTTFSNFSLCFFDLNRISELFRHSLDDNLYFKEIDTFLPFLYNDLTNPTNTNNGTIQSHIFQIWWQALFRKQPQPLVIMLLLYPTDWEGPALLTGFAFMVFL